MSEPSLEEQEALAQAAETQNVQRPGGTSGMDVLRATSSPICLELQEGEEVQQKAQQETGKGSKPSSTLNRGNNRVLTG